MKFFLFTLSVLLLWGCKQKLDPVDEITPVTEINTSQKSSTSKYDYYPELLRGEWFLESDKSTKVIFTSTEKQTYINDQGQAVIESYEISDRCTNAKDADNKSVKNNSYLSFDEKDECYYIIRLSEETLNLSLVGKAKTISFTRKKEKK